MEIPDFIDETTDESAGFGRIAMFRPVCHRFPDYWPLSQKRLSARSLCGRRARRRGFRPAAARLRGRAANSGSKNAHPLWGESMEQAGQGRLLPPTPHSANGNPIGWHSEEYNLSLLFEGASVGGDLRAFDDLKRSMVLVKIEAFSP